MVKPERLGHLVLSVRDVERSTRFYTEILGLEITAKMNGSMVFLSASHDSSHELALISVGPQDPVPEEGRVGLYHFAWRMASLEKLRNLYVHLKNKGCEIVGIGDHGISLGIYFLDPDGNKVEAFYELPSRDWPEKNIFSGKFPGSLNNEPDQTSK